MNPTLRQAPASTARTSVPAGDGARVGRLIRALVANLTNFLGIRFAARKRVEDSDDEHGDRFIDTDRDEDHSDRDDEPRDKDKVGAGSTCTGIFVNVVERN